MNVSSDDFIFDSIADCLDNHASTTSRATKPPRPDRCASFSAKTNRQFNLIMLAVIFNRQSCRSIDENTTPPTRI
jgi:hypothetical protein